MKIILASASPRRAELLKTLGLAFDIIPSTVDEKAFDVSHLSPEETVKFLAKVKADAVAAEYPEALVIGADTIVVIDGDVLGKPRDEAEAKAMLQRLQNATHEVYTGISLFWQSRGITGALRTRVSMKALTEAEIDWYVATGEPMDKAGAYAIQGYGSTLIPEIEGDYFNVVGLSLYLLNQLSQQLGIQLVSQPDIKSLTR